MTSGQYLIEYVKKTGWFWVANIFHDNGYTSQPHTTNGCICASPSLEQFFILNKTDFENTPVIEQYLAVYPNNEISPQQMISSCAFRWIQRFDTLLGTHSTFYKSFGDFDEFPVPTIPNDSDILALTPDPETGLYSGPNITTADYNDGVASVYNLYPFTEWGDMRRVGIRIDRYQSFLRNQKKFCQAMNLMHGVSDCL